MGYGEADTRAKLIDPTLYSRSWTEENIRREETAGAIHVVDGVPKKQAKGRTDYTLRIKVRRDTQPVAVAIIEAKAEDLPPTHGMEQAKVYAASKRLHVPFVFSTNGHLYVEYDFFTGKTTNPTPLNLFPKPDELQSRYEKGVGFSLDDPAAKPLLTPYSGGEATRRYYQDAAIRAVLEKIARCAKDGTQLRALLSLATGAGKTFIAVNLLRRIADAGQLRRALFVCDRDELRTQASGALQNAFGSDAASAIAGNPEKNARVVIATYQTLGVDTDDADASFLKRNYPPDYFSHIVIDECHRSAWGKWAEVLKRNPTAMQIGLTATPRQLEITENTKESKADAQITADNYEWFGPPVYEYDMAQGIEDGYLAACEIRKGRVNLDNTGITIDQIMALGPKNANTGQPITRAELQDLYDKTQFEDRILLPDRVLAMCGDLFAQLLDTGGPEQKTIIFCARDRHADDVATQMNNLYADWCHANSKPVLAPYAFKCTASVDGANYIADLKGASRSYFIATTVDLLTTGVDVPAVRNIAFFKYVKSPISFYQMVGRGTRIDAPSNKLMFRVFDYTDATRLFGEAFRTKATPPKNSGPPALPGPPPLPPVMVEGFEVHVSNAGRYLVTNVDGKAMPVTVEEYKERVAAQLVQEAPTLDVFRRRWTDPAERGRLMAALPDAGRSAELLRALQEMDDFDLYDVLGDLGYGLSPRTRKNRAEAFTYKQAAWLAALPPQTAAAIKAITGQFAQAGTDGLENRELFQTPEVSQAGGLAALKAAGEPAELVRQTKERMFAA
jgi:type I restriction enzyme R subunit